MKKFFLLLAATALVAATAGLTMAAKAGEEEVVFEDAFKDTPGEGWTWLREDKEDWRIADGALEVRARPGDAQSVRNALLRSVPDADGKGIVVEVTVTFTAELTQQYEQAGITWYADDAPVFKLVHERIDGDYYIIPGKIPAKEKAVRLRLEVNGTKFVAKFREEGQDNYTVAAEGDITIGKDNKLSLQTYHGPVDADHWMRFSNFKIMKTN